MPDRRFGLLLAALLLSTFLAYLPSLKNGFLGWDDPQLVTENAAVLSFDAGSLALDAFQSNHHPLTMLSYALEHALFGLDPLPYHVTNLLLHLLNTALVAWFVLAVCVRPAAALACAGLFALHPLHVESVAWIAERKDVLSTFFSLVALVWYATRTKQRRKTGWLLLVLFLAALLSKPMAVTLPLVLVGLDVFRERRLTASMLRSKWIYFALSIGFGVLALRAQSTGAIVAVEPDRLDRVPGNAARSLIFYLSKTIWPDRLSVYYAENLLQLRGIDYLLAGAGLGLLLLALRLERARSSILFGLYFFAVTISLVLKLIPFGEASLVNDRYMYLPSIGLFLAGAVALDARGLLRGWIGIGAACAVLLACGVATHARCKVWRNDETLWLDVLKNYPRTIKAHEYLAIYYDGVGKLDQALAHMEQAAALDPTSAGLLLNLGVVYGRLGRHEAARQAFERCVAANPLLAVAQFNLGASYFVVGRLEEAEPHLRRAHELDRSLPMPPLFLGRLERRRGNLPAAERWFELAIERAPMGAEGYLELSSLLEETGRAAEAHEILDRARRRGVSLPHQQSKSSGD